MDSFVGKTPAGHLLSTKFEKDPIECISSALPYICFGLAMHRQTQYKKAGRPKASQDPADILVDEKPLVELPMPVADHSPGKVNAKRTAEKSVSVVKPKAPKVTRAATASKPQRLELGSAATKYQRNLVYGRKLFVDQQKHKIAARSLLATKYSRIPLAQKKSTRRRPEEKKLTSVADAAKKPAKKPAKAPAKKAPTSSSVRNLALRRRQFAAKERKQSSKDTKPKDQTGRK